MHESVISELERLSEMNITSQNLQAISQIYDVTLDSDQWSSVLDELTYQLGAIGSNVFVVVSDQKITGLSSLYVSTQLAPALNVYLERGYNKNDETFMPNYHDVIPHRGFRSSLDAYHEHNLKYGTKLDTGDLDEYMAGSWGVAHRYASRLNIRKTYIDFCTFHFGELTKTQLQSSLSLATCFLPHLAKAVEISRPFSLLKARFNAVLSVLDRFHLGVIIFSSSGSMVLSNQAAQVILDSNDGLKLRKRNLSATYDSASNSNLKDAFFTANKALDGPTDGQTKRVYVPRRSGVAPYIVDISPLRNREIDLRAFFRGTIAIIVDPDHHHIIDVSGLELLFSLTKAEMEVCHQLVSGYSTSEIADTRGTNPETVRKQINMILSKTEARGRSELVHLAHSINLPVDLPE